jgi:hypothetical protein
MMKENAEIESSCCPRRIRIYVGSDIHPRTTLLLGFGLIFVASLGCDFRPNNHENIVAERGVSQVPKPVKLDATEIQRIVDIHKNEPPGDPGLTGKTIESSGIIESIETLQTEDRSILKVQIRSSKEPRFIAECYFADQHRLSIQKLAVGDTLHVRGKCRNAFETRVELTGCLIQDPEDPVTSSE